jgi:hypothetical protein
MLQSSFRFAQKRLWGASIASLQAMLTAAGCADESGGGACSSFFAPFSVVDAGQPGCTAEPAGTICDPSSGNCPNMCQPGEYLLTCSKRDISALAIPEEALRDPVVATEGGIQCTVSPPRDGGGSAVQYCCQCKR